VFFCMTIPRRRRCSPSCTAWWSWCYSSVLGKYSRTLLNKPGQDSHPTFTTEVAHDFHSSSRSKCTRQL
jgi:hypothetical protein